MEHFLLWIFYVWACTYFFSFNLTCIHSTCYTSDVHLIMCELCEKNWLKELVDYKKKYVLFSSMFFIYIYRYNFDFFTKMYFDHLLKFCVSYCYYIAQAIHDSNPFIPLQTCFKLHGYSSFKKKKKPKYLKCRYLANYFKKMKQNILKLIR
jgi:hypothetical protein